MLLGSAGESPPRSPRGPQLQVDQKERGGSLLRQGLHQEVLPRGRGQARWVSPTCSSRLSSTPPHPPPLKDERGVPVDPPKRPQTVCILANP
ncbi:UNVERIFIED_CONTAM: hypothetical protein Slati_1940400 [Sesamum latifolium]|uniref:Uncharacterized protein n=1 Tax=Sesamum latifolium TaxID=2727402 RepID=A0AAW2X7F8_9LAMI